MAKPASTAPNIRQFELPELTDVTTDDLEIDAEREGERFVDVDASGRELMGIRFSECELDGVSLGDSDLRGSRFIETVITRLNAPILSAPHSTWRDVRVSQSRVGSTELYESNWRSVRFEHCKIGYLNLRASQLVDVEFVDCTFDEVDLGGAKVTRSAFADCAIQNLDVARATLLNLDLRGAELRSIRGVESLRGAIISELQLVELAPLLADHLGLSVTP